MRTPIKALVKIAVLPNYRPSGFDACNIVWGGGGGFVSYDNIGFRQGEPTHDIREGRG